MAKNTVSIVAAGHSRFGRVTDLTLEDLIVQVTREALTDAAVDASYGYKGGATDAARVAFLFGLYQQLTSLLPADGGKPRRARRVNAEAV